MCKSFEVEENLFYVGVNDRTQHLFENLRPLPKGVSYNSYIINDDRYLLCGCFFNKIHSVLWDRTIDYLVVDHMEPPIPLEEWYLFMTTYDANF